MLNGKSDHLYIQRHLKILSFGMLALFTIIGLLMLTGLLQSAKGTGPPRVYGIFWLGIISWYWYWILSMPHTIVVAESGQVEVVSVIRRRQTTLREIQSIRPDLKDRKRRDQKPRRGCREIWLSPAGNCKTSRYALFL